MWQVSQADDYIIVILQQIFTHFEGKYSETNSRVHSSFIYVHVDKEKNNYE